MSSVRFRSGTVDLELSGSESFVNRQLRLLSRYLEHADRAALDGVPDSSGPANGDGNGNGIAAPAAPAEASDLVPGIAPTNGNGVSEAPAPEAAAPAEEDGLLDFYRAHEPKGRDRQGDAALLFGYYLQRYERIGEPFKLGDLIRCCIRAGVDTRNFHRTLGALARRGLLDTLRHGHAYQLTEQGVAAVESRLS